MTQALASFRDLIADEQVFLVRARVAVLEGDTTHFFTNTEGDMVIGCLSMRHGTPMYALLRGGADDGSGTWAIPDPGTEVMVGFDGGDVESDGFIVSTHGTRWPSGISSAQVHVVGDSVEARSFGGTAVSLAKKSDVQDIRDYVNNQFSAVGGHTHAVSGAATTSIISVAAEGASPPTIPPGEPDGTDVLKGE